MGTGFLTLPWAFNSAGIVLSLITLGCVCLISDVSKDYILETMSRADALFRARSRSEGRNLASLSIHSAVDLVKLETGKIKSYGSTAASSDETAGLLTPPSGASSPHLVRSRKFEVVELCSMFLGDKGSSTYIFTLGLYMYGTLWAYTSVFANACSYALPLSKIFGVGVDDYLVYVAVFASVVVPLTCMELKEQVAVQVFLSLCRFLMVIVMVGSVSYAMHATTAQFDDQTSCHGSSLVNFSGLYKMLPIAVYANIFHHSIPGLSSPVADKSKLSMIFGSTFAFGMIAYGLIGGVVAWYFGDSIDQSANLNWVGYHAGTGAQTPEGNWTHKSWLTAAIAYFVVVFPATDVVSAFPLNGITLGNSLMGMWFGPDIRDYENDVNIVRYFRLMAAVPSIIGACFVRDLGFITAYTGITGFAIAFTFPALLNVNSKRACNRAGIDSATAYTKSFVSSDLFSYVVAIFGGILIVFVFGSLIYEET
eukprot:CAMPEP_0182503332 /NCGR_PEP_ID=MMETSP1321-20130603/15133_1 /TAXON_ID=91990 /ORGANISM="Bolidomonas sp., Strain RCC1657" /LENGTH=479 /DNA_ID=CAMNT_0024708485 /DNA_START=47 /DNA_END=1482 /DNA_ORIENTATION=+